MSADEHTQLPQPPRRKANRPALFAYMVALFAVAFLLILMSYFMQQRRSDQQLIEEGLQKNASALQITQSVQKQNEELRSQLSAAEAENETLQKQNENMEQTILAMDWLWRIEREYFRKSYSNARKLIEEFESSGLKEWLHAGPLVDPDYRSPLEQYEAMYDSLF
ncbi:MAG: hypothetical protein IJB75_04515 [Oscillospiraceae bacterium]|nr:hypothetical protein [Oscillospiraceae bacterium]